MRILKNIWLKLFALVIAFSLWYVTVPHEARDIGEENFIIPIRIINVPSSLVIMGDLPDTIQVRVRGVKNSMDTFTKASKSFTIDLKNERPGTQTIPVLQSRLGIPDDLEIISIQPVNVVVHLESRLQKLIPITAQISVAPPKNTRWDVSVIPENALVVGPESIVNSLNSVATMAIEPSTAEETYRTDVLLTPPHSLVRIIQPLQVSVIIRTVEIPSRKKRR
ncbi:MAG TPA: hypothetical protein PK014_12105 [Thermoanaerobaculia bacterium]|nr:hypothetical protein [Thermoanaerobaculia bacterium]HUM30809.1 hypothetical protein [Thermoanaerobaculia bacterium]HXK69144.1 hypothetical protein [Thermoanaerobaculia bacterium]